LVELLEHRSDEAWTILRMTDPTKAAGAGERTCVFHNGTVILPDRTVQNGAVLCRGGRISAVGPREGVAVPHDAVQVDAHGGYIAPGYVDIHSHGGGGADFMDGTPAAFVAALRAHARHGTTTMFPTTTTGSRAEIETMLRACLDVRDSWAPSDGARLGGVHFYGPYFATEMVGAHPRGCDRSPDPEEYLAFFDLGIIRIATCAAELPGAEAFCREASRRGYLVTCGHSNSTWTEMQRCFDAGLRHVDHFWSAMSSVASLRQRFNILEQPMQGSMEQFVLMRPEMSTEVLADGCHLARELLAFAFRMKGPERLCLVTDSSRALDMPPGSYRLGPRDSGAPFTSNGRVGYQPPGSLASTVVGMDAMVRNMNEMSGAGLCETVRMASLTPAERAGVDQDAGSLECGKWADVLVLDRDLTVRQVFIAGSEFAGAPPRPPAHRTT
jgi:N-acetylglucosamine-6-phosphate deacetylase